MGHEPRHPPAFAGICGSIYIRWGKRESSLIKLSDLSYLLLFWKIKPHLTCEVHGETVTSSTLNPNRSTLWRTGACMCIVIQSRAIVFHNVQHYFSWTLLLGETRHSLKVGTCSKIAWTLYIYMSSCSFRYNKNEHLDLPVQ